ncbi:hydroxyacylglutathione hydrolase [Pelagibacteraceae bacterium]|nr:hydroxyacylglutathione hydrolase [Pelagibacteraceae bacterium]
MKIEIIPCLEDNYSYLVIDQVKNIACVIDPSEAKPIIDFLEKNKISLKFILNTHHHYDHVGGNKELKEKYKAMVIGYDGDKERIPELDISVKDNEIWKYENFEVKIFHIPGHTLGHICFYFYKEESVFTGDTLFSLGCGKIFEGTYSQMYNSLMKIKILPQNTKIYCGHEYTKQNSNFCIANDKNNKNLKNKIKEVDIKLEKKLPTIPSTIKEEIECNIFLRSNNIETFSKLRDLKDNS